jgi:hypothetical protein
MLQPEPTNSGGKWRTVRRGAVGLALFGIAGWLWRQNNRPADEIGQTGNDTSDQKRT